MNQTFPPAPARAAPDYDNVTVANSPLALDPKQLDAEVEDEVVPLVVQRAGNAIAELHRLVHDGRLGYEPLLICRQFTQHVKRSASLGRSVS